MLDVGEMSVETILSTIGQIIPHFETHLPSRVDPAQVTLESKIPFKILSLRELLYWRITTLSRSAYDLYLQDRKVASFILIRSVMETTALCYNLRKKMLNFPANMPLEEFDDFLMDGLLGGRDEKAMRNARSIATCIKHIDREYEGYQKMYDVLCEYVHPNYLGTFGIYGKVDYENLWVDLGENIREAPPSFGLAPFLFSLSVFEEQYQIIGNNLEHINEHFSAH